MSLINEALKRTRDASFQAADHQSPVVEAYRMSLPPPPSKPKVHLGYWIGLCAVIATAVLALYFRGQARQPAAPVVVHRAAPVVAAPASPPPVAAAPVAPPVVVEKPKPEPAPVSVPAPPPPAPEPPKLVLQGITADARGREAMINDSSVREGDEIEGARVIVIESRRVKLQFGDREFSIRMP